jgi:hypothetical protein
MSDDTIKATLHNLIDDGTPRTKTELCSEVGAGHSRVWEILTKEIEDGELVLVEQERIEGGRAMPRKIVARDTRPVTRPATRPRKPKRGKTQ